MKELDRLCTQKMNRVLYTLEEYNKDKKKATKRLIFSICVFVLGLLFLGLSAFLINPKTVLFIKVIDSIFVSICFIIAIYIFIELFLETKFRNKFIYRLLTVERFEGKIKITKIREPYRVRKHVKAYEIEAIDENQKEITCYFEDRFDLGLKVGEEIKVIIASNFITEIVGNDQDE